MNCLEWAPSLVAAGCPNRAAALKPTSGPLETPKHHHCVEMYMASVADWFRARRLE